MRIITYSLPVLVTLIGGSILLAARMQSSLQEQLWQKSFWRSATVADVQQAISDGADVISPNREGLSPLSLAAMESNDEKVIGFLIDAGADVNAAGADWGWTPLFLASMNSQNPKVIETLIERGADVEQRCIGINSTPLIDAVVHNPSSAVVLALLKAGANPHAKDDKGFSAVDYVQLQNSHHKNSQVYDWLVKGKQNI